ncbi:MAG: peptidylprolyl isomerase [Candidatus Margulisbacteria bacterium]|jgi:parvulin-like peptidyl-prolyl isomerase|nr:peptidylprolyl isomerase [Candidatus Margulisiibacteriota bacterium]
MLDFMRRNAEKIIWLIVIAFVLSLGILSFNRPSRGSSRPGAPIDPAALAAIDGRPVDTRLFNRMYMIGLRGYVEPGQRDQLDPKTTAYVAHLALLQTIDTEKKLDYAKRLKIKVRRGEINQQIEALKTSYQLSSDEELKNLLSANGLDYKTFRQEIKQELMLNKLQENILRAVAVDEQDVKNQYKQVRARHILIAFNRPGLADRPEKEKIKLAGDVAADLYDQLLKGADFAELAGRYSDDTGSALQGGDLGFFGVDAMVPEFETVAFRLEPGQISKPFQTVYGHHIVKVEEIKQDEIPLDVDEQELQKELLAKKQNNALQQFSSRLQSEYETKILYPEFQAYEQKINGNLSAALDLYRALCAQNPQSPAPYLFTAEIYELLGQNAEALAEYNKALLVQKLNPALKTPYIHFYLANYYAKQKQNAKAVQELQLAEAAVSDNLNILERIKDQYTKLNSAANADKIDVKIRALEQARTAAQTAGEELQFAD